MKISDKLKQVIFKKLYKDLSHVEIIPFNKNIWFIDRENKYWYFEYEHRGKLYWRYDFFNSFFSLFSLDSDDYKSIISEWVEEVLNCKVLTTKSLLGLSNQEVEEVLNCKVLTTCRLQAMLHFEVEEVLNCKVLTTLKEGDIVSVEVEEVLNCKVRTVKALSLNQFYTVEEILKL